MPSPLSLCLKWRTVTIGPERNTEDEKWEKEKEKGEEEDEATKAWYLHRSAV
jgi:hypothetical protein